MATKQTKTQAPAEGIEEAQEQAFPASESQAEAHVPGKARMTAPVAPRVTSGASPGAIMRIRDLLAGGLYKRHPQALEEAIAAIEGISMLKAHPAVGIYKAEVLDYLRGKIIQRDERAA